MTVVIEDEKTVREIERLSRERAISPEEFVREAVLEKAGREHVTEKKRLNREEKWQAIRDFQAWYASYRDPNDNRTADEVIGYNENGLFD